MGRSGGGGGGFSSGGHGGGSHHGASFSGGGGSFRSSGSRGGGFGSGPSVFTDLIERVDAHIHLVVVLIHDADHLLIAVAGRHTHQSAELSDTIIHMHDEVAIIHLLQLLHGERHLSGSCRI